MNDNRIDETDLTEQLPDELLVLQSLRQIIRSIDVHSRKLESVYKITGPQLLCLRIVQSNLSTTATKIAQQAYLSNSTVVGILDRLEKGGYIIRERDLHDKRKWNVVLSDKANSLLKVVPTSPHDGLLRALKSLPEQELASIAVSISQIVELLGAETLDAAPILETTAIEVN